MQPSTHMLQRVHLLMSMTRASPALITSFSAPISRARRFASASSSVREVPAARRSAAWEFSRIDLRSSGNSLTRISRWAEGMRTRSMRSTATMLVPGRTSSTRVFTPKKEFSQYQATISSPGPGRLTSFAWPVRTR